MRIEVLFPVGRIELRAEGRVSCATMLQRRIHDNGVVTYGSPLLSAVGVVHAFSTRLGGLSEGPFASLNLGVAAGVEQRDSDSNISENHKRWFDALGCADRTLARVHQVHGNDVITCGQGAGVGDLPGRDVQADALVTRDRSVAVTVRVADCVPVLMSTSDGRCVGAAHAGWRGVVGGVVVNTLHRLLELSGGAGARDVVVAIGPSIGADAFEVGAEVVTEFTRAFTTHAKLIRPRTTGKATIDLRAALMDQLIEAGVPGAQIESTDRCTFTHADEFFSHRRDRGLTGRMAALVTPR